MRVQRSHHRTQVSPALVELGCEARERETGKKAQLGRGRKAGSYGAQLARRKDWVASYPSQKHHPHTLLSASRPLRLACIGLEDHRDQLVYRLPHKDPATQSSFGCLLCTIRLLPSSKASGKEEDTGHPHCLKAATKRVIPRWQRVQELPQV